MDPSVSNNFDWNIDLITRLCISARLRSRAFAVSKARQHMSAVQRFRGETKPQLLTSQQRQHMKKSHVEAPFGTGSCKYNIKQMVPSYGNNSDWDIDLISSLCICACVISRAFAVSTACQYTFVQGFRHETISCLWTSHQRQRMRNTLNTNTNINLLQKVLGECRKWKRKRSLKCPPGHPGSRICLCGENFTEICQP